MSTSFEQPGKTVGEDDRLYEVVFGQRQELEPMGALEVGLAAVIFGCLQPFVLTHRLGIVVSEMLFVLDESRGLKRRPDLAFVSYARWPHDTIAREEAWNTVPDLAIEIVSPTNSAEGIDEKTVEYFQAGVKLVWVLYPDSGRVYVYRSATEVSITERSGELEGGEVLPGFRVAIQSFFDGLKKPS